jgi:hypothetical protein
MLADTGRFLRGSSPLSEYEVVNGGAAYLEKNSLLRICVVRTMSEQDPELEAFSEFIVAIAPWLGEVALVGGWAHRLYRLDPRSRKLDCLPLTTRDGHVAVPPKRVKEESTVRKSPLEAQHVSYLEGRR